MTDPGADSRQLVRQALAGEDDLRVRPRGRLAVHYCARLGGVSLRQYTIDARTMADCVVRYYERFRPDAVWVSADTWVTAQAMGAVSGFPSDDQPMGGMGEPVVQSLGRRGPDSAARPGSQGRWPLMIEALKRRRGALRGRAFVVACFDQYPFSLACALMGMQRVMTGVMDDRTLIEALMERCCEYAQAYAVALAAAGADMLSGGDSPAGLIGPRLYRQVALPAEQQRHPRHSRPHRGAGFAAHLRRGHADPGRHGRPREPTSWSWTTRWICEQACQYLGRDVAIWGNLDPVAVLARGTCRRQ